MYQKYHTEAIVLKAYENGEADRTLALYTREFGLVRARATAVRREHSKMRYALQLYSRANVSLVRGKRGWRAAGAAAVAAAPAAHVGIFARIAELTMRLIAGEEANAYLFETLVDTHETLAHAEPSQTPLIEIVSVARVLYSLGYLSAEAVGTALFTHTLFSREHLKEASLVRDKILSSINRALAETHL